MSVQGFTSNKYAVASPISGQVSQAQKATALQGAIAQVKSNNQLQTNVGDLYKPIKLNAPSTNVTVFSSGLGGLRRGDTKVTYGNYSEYGSNVLQLAGAVVTLPITGTLGAFISAIYASAELNEAYKAYLAGDKKGVAFHLGLAGISAIPACKEILKAFGVLKAAKVAPKVAGRIKTGEEIRTRFVKLRHINKTVYNNEIFLGKIKKIAMGQTPYLLLEDLSKHVPPKIQQRILNWVTKNSKDLDWINIDKRVSEINKFCDNNLSSKNNYSYSILIKEFLKFKGF